MTRRIFSIAICLVMAFGTFFHVGGPQSGFVGQAVAAEAFLPDIAGISAYTKVVPGTNFYTEAQLACNGEFEFQTETYFICSVPIDGYADIYAPHVFVSSDGWIMAYYLKDEPAAKMLDVIAQPLDAGLAYPTLLEKALFKVLCESDLIEVITNTTLTGTLDALTAHFPETIPVDIVDAPYKINSKMSLAEPLTEETTVSITLSVNGSDAFAYVTDVPIPSTEFWVTDLFEGAVAADFDANYAGRIEIYSITVNGNTVDTDVTIQSIISLDGFSTEIVLAEITLPIEGEVIEPTVMTSFHASEAVETVPYEIYYYDFSQPGATNMLMIAEDKSEDGGDLGDENYWMTLALPEATYYETSYAFYQNYYPDFSLDGSNFVTSDADYVGPITLGSIYGTLEATLVSGTPYLFEVDTFSYADAGYGALLFTFSDASGDFTIDSADWVQPFTLAAPPTELTDKFTFDFAPGAFTKKDPLDKTTGVGTSVTLSWDGIIETDSYEYCIDESLGGICDTAWVNTGTSTSVTLSGLPYNATYYWQVRAVNSYTTTEADGGEWWTFSTITGAPAPFVKINPSNNLEDVATSPLLDWADADGAEYYEYCIGFWEFEDCDEDDQNDWTPTGLISQAVVDLDDNIKYVWQVRAVNSAGETYADLGTLWNFTTVGSFTKTSPTNGATGIDPKATFEWDEMVGATSYQYCVDTTDNDSCSRWKDAGNVTEIALKGLKYETTYYWQVRAVTETGTTEADAGEWWSFTTRYRKAPIKNPTSFSKVAPADGSFDQAVKNLELTWESINDATSYAYCIDTTDDSKCTNWIQTNETTATIVELLYETTYYWQVRAIVNGVVNYADDGSYWSFTTIAEPVIE